ncbi:MAG: hypothetical protein KC543_07735 [Myxococcales bacterium]|nr:hypothetical protein [Myxococcales bacterium]
MTDQLDKLVYVLWGPEGRAPRAHREVLLGDVAPALLRGGAERLQVNIADDLADVPSPAPKVLFDEPACAQVNAYVDDPTERRFALEDAMRAAGYEVAGYRVDEQIYTEYGGNRHSGPRDWPDGERSPGVLAVTLMERPKRLSYDEWIRRWHGRQSPVSEAMQPRARYVRNVVLEPITPGAPPFEGIVEEDWPSAKHVTDPYLFYGATNPLELATNMAKMLASVTAFLDLWRIRTLMMSEYFIKS